MDNVDIANEQADQLLALRLKAARQPDGPAGNGICADCDNAIEPARLAVLPSAVRCAGCQQDHERSLKSYNGEAHHARLAR